MLALSEVMDQLMRNAFVSTARWFDDVSTPAVDVMETPEGFTVKAALPGWKPEDVDVTVENGMLILRGEWKQEEEHKDDNSRWLRREIRYSSFERSIQLPTEVEADKAKAVFENGILTLTIPKAEVVKPKHIKITVK
jgi:HSP20 family protein